MQQTLAQYLEALNSDAQARMAAEDGLWVSTLTTDLEHWAGYGIYTAEQLGDYLDACCEEE